MKLAGALVLVLVGCQQFGFAQLGGPQSAPGGKLGAGPGSLSPAGAKPPTVLGGPPPELNGGSSVGAALNALFKTFAYYSLFPQIPNHTAVQSNPLAASGFNPKLPSRVGGQVGPEYDAHYFRLIKGGATTEDNQGIIHSTGGVEATYKGYRMLGDTLEGNQSSQVYILSGHAQIIGPDAIVTANRIIIDYRNRTYEAYTEESDLKPSLVGGVLQTDVYQTAKHSHGSLNETFSEEGGLTTCNYDEPHYQLYARETDIRFHKRIIFKDLDVYVLQKRLLHVPYLSIPLDNRQYNNLPEVGENAVEGYFIKTRYGIPLSGDQSLSTRIDYMTKLGVGLGADYAYHKDKGKDPYDGTISVYGVSGSQTVDVEQAHEQLYGWGKLQIQNSLQQHDYLSAPDNTILNNRVNLSFIKKTSSTNFNFNNSTNQSPGFNSAQRSFGLTDTRSLSSALKTNTQVTFTDSANSYNNNGSATSIDRKEVDVNFRAEDDLKKADALLEYQRNIPVGHIQGFYGITDRAPNVTLETDSSRLVGAQFGHQVPIKTDLAIGQFGDPQSGVDITRDRFDVSYNHTDDATKRARLDVSSQFSQSFYSDNTAQYVVGTGLGFSYGLGKDTSFNLRYNYLRPEGFTPLGIDQQGQLNLASEDISFRPERSLLFGLQSSYDLIQSHLGNVAWSPLSLRAEYSPTSYIFLRNLTTYDPFYKGVANYRFDFSYKPGATFVGLGARYDNTRHTWAETDFYLSALKMGRVKADLRLSYNGYSNQFNSRQLSLVYDLHCAEAVLQIIDNPIGFNLGTQYLFFIRLKGLPFDSSFGAGNRGQPIGYGTGVGY